MQANTNRPQQIAPAFPAVEFKKDSMTEQQRAETVREVNSWLARPDLERSKRNVLSTVLNYIEADELVKAVTSFTLAKGLIKTNPARFLSCERIFNSVNLPIIDFLDTVIAELQAISGSSNLRDQVLPIAILERSTLIGIESKKIQKIAFELAALAVILVLTSRKEALILLPIAGLMIICSDSIVEWRLEQARTRRIAGTRGLHPDNPMYIDDGMQNIIDALSHLGRTAQNAVGGTIYRTANLLQTFTPRDRPRIAPAAQPEQQAE
jgi:hypothetical protein